MINQQIHLSSLFLGKEKSNKRAKLISNLVLLIKSLHAYFQMVTIF